MAIYETASRGRGAWWHILLIGLALFVVGVLVFGVTGNLNLFPTVALIGNLLVPVGYVAFFYERRHMSQVTLVSIALGLIEEFAKILGVLVVARHHRHDSEIDGVILGAAAGMGFAALESSGYVFTAFVQSGGSLSALVLVTLLRGLLSPVGHGTWTAILASVLFREGMPNRFRINRSVLGAYLTVVVLHGLWDGVPQLLTVIAGPGLDVFLAQGAVGVAGLVILWRRWREAVRRELGPVETAPIESTT